MNFKEALTDYLALRHGLGFKMWNAGFLLRRFVAHLECTGASHLTTEVALQWAKGDGHRMATTEAARLTEVRQFARYLVGIDPRTEVPDKGLIPARIVRSNPYIYSDLEIRNLLKAARQMEPLGSLRGSSYATFFGLLAATGMRLREGLALSREDVNLGEGVIEVRESKFRRSRLVPVAASTVAALKAYSEVRDNHHPRPSCPNFFVDVCGGPLLDWKVRYHFVRLSVATGLRETIHRGPRMHDFRHTFAVRTLIRWYEDGVDVNQKMPQLSTYLGHVHVADTYWYISACPELLRLAGARIEKSIRRLL